MLVYKNHFYYKNFLLLEKDRIVYQSRHKATI